MNNKVHNCFIIPIVLLLAFLPNLTELRVDKRYENFLFTDKVHSIEIDIEESNWNDILKSPIEEKYYPCDIIIDGKVFKNVGIKTKGNTSLELVAKNDKTDRYSFKIKFDKYEKGQTCYGLDELSLNNVFADSTYMKEYLAYDMFKKIGAVSPLCSFMNISINNKNWGLYIGVENIDESFLIRNFGEDYGNLYKPESRELRYMAQNGEGVTVIKGEDLVYKDDNFDTYFTVFDTAKTDIEDNDKVRLINSLKNLHNNNVEECVDIENTLKYWVVNNFICNFDSYVSDFPHNYYLYEQSGKLTLLPWDYNLSFGSYPHTVNKDYTYDLDDATNMVNISMLKPLNENQIGLRPMFEKVVENSYEDKYNEYINIFINDYFNSGYFEEKYNNTITMIKPYIEKDNTAFYNLEDIEKGQKVLKEFIDLRVKAVKGQLGGDIIDRNYSTYIDATHINMEDIGHQKDGYMPIK